ncbi:MAG: class I SAM-dependent rRNA methyltransferase [Verrucomicrobiae bacterium]|nr:class I SAM-dependent rRNA methyltransferase [Verrucomicrobiae bacterium]
MKQWRDQLKPAPDAETTAWRRLHSREGVWVDDFDGRWLVQTQGSSFPDELRDAVTGGEARSLYWKPRDKDAKTAPEWIAGEKVTEPFLVTENGVRFWIDFEAGYSQGIFLDQRENRRRVLERVGEGDRVLNTFAYTCAFSAAAAVGGAVTSSLDLSRPYLDWGKRNLEANGIDPAGHYFCKGDVFEWLGTFHRQGRTFQGVILDPPTFSRNGKGKVFKADRDYADLVALACGVVESGGWVLCTGNTHRLDNRSFEKAVREGVRQGRRKVERVEVFPMPEEFNGDDYLKTVWVTVG